MENTIKNPILKGFHPDPSIVRVKDDFYIATSTFEWFPGVMIYHSKNLRDWTLVAQPVNRLSQIDMTGCRPSAGVWAPCLSHDGEKFHLIYTNVRTWTGVYKDTHNYLITSQTIEGPWSEPIYMNSSGFDPSLFHDDDGKKWFVNMIWDYRKGHNDFAGHVLQEYDPQQQKLVGPIKNIWKGTSIGLTEGPHIYKKDGYYYLMAAEGGTSYNHSESIARSKSIWGPYEESPSNPLITAVKDRKGFLQATENQQNIFPFLKKGIQKTGHGSLCHWQGDEWVFVHLCGRPLEGTEDCPLGRETSIQKVIWPKGGWPILAHKNPQEKVSFQGLEFSSPQKEEQFFEENFDKEKIDPSFMSLRRPKEEFLNLTERSGWASLVGQESIESPFNQSLLGRRVQSFEYFFETKLDFSPEDFQQMAGILFRYDEQSQYYLRLSFDESLNQRALGIIQMNRVGFDMPLEREIPILEGDIRLAGAMKNREIQFFYSQGNDPWTAIGPRLDSRYLSDDSATPMGFTGLFAAIACQDTSGRRKKAYFNYFRCQNSLPSWVKDFLKI